MRETDPGERCLCISFHQRHGGEADYLGLRICAGGEGEGFDPQIWFFQSGEEEAGIRRAMAIADTEKIGIMGHSLGGAASVTVGRSRDDIGAVINLDGTMLGEEIGCENGVYECYEEPYPVLMIDNEEHYREGEKLTFLCFRRFWRRSWGRVLWMRRNVLRR